MIANLNNVIKALECDEWRPSVCKLCEYGYLDDHGDSPTWTCNEERKINEALFFFKTLSTFNKGTRKWKTIKLIILQVAVFHILQ